VGSSLELRILGPVEIRRAGQLLVPRRRLARVLLGMLALRANDPVSREWIIHGLWPRHPPRSAEANVRTYVAGLRYLLARADGPRIESANGSYRLVTGAAGLDALLFDRLAAEGRQHLAAGRYAAAAERLTRACGLWRGPVMDGTTIPEPVAITAIMLEDRQLDVIEDCVEARLAIGQHADLAIELRSLTEIHGLRERLWGQRMLALYRCGRQAEALATYQDLTRTLDSELGVTPSLPLRSLHRRILRSDPDLVSTVSRTT
jgi:DNA-binding SARP family transcriptional activator